MPQKQQKSLLLKNKTKTKKLNIRIGLKPKLEIQFDFSTFFSVKRHKQGAATNLQQ